VGDKVTDSDIGSSVAGSVPKTVDDDVATEQALVGRLAQLQTDNLLHFYESALSHKRVLWPAAGTMPSRSIAAGLRCKKEFLKRAVAKVEGQLPSSGIYEFENCFVGKGGTVITEQRKVMYAEDLMSSYWMWFLGKLIAKAGPHRTPAQPTTPTGLFINGEDAPVVDLEAGGATVVSLLKPGSIVYGHWILDTLPMTYAFFEAVKVGVVKPPFKFLISDTTPSWARGFLKLLFDIEEKDLIVFNENIALARADKIVVPSLLRVSPLISPRMNDFVSYVHERLGTAARPLRDDLPKQFYISRKDYYNHRRTLIGMDGLEGLMREMGVQPLQPELLPWPDQIKLFAEAELVAAEYGSGLHGTMFGPASTVNVAFLNKHSNDTQSAIASLRGQDLVYVRPMSEEESSTKYGVRYEYDLDDLRQAIVAAREVRHARFGG